MDFPARTAHPSTCERRTSAGATLLLVLAMALSWSAGITRAATVDTQPAAIAAMRADQTRSAAELRDQALAMRDTAAIRRLADSARPSAPLGSVDAERPS